MLSAVIPSSAPVGSQPIALLITGSNFVAGSTVQWNTGPLPTTMLSSTQLQAQLSNDNLSVLGTFYIRVNNPLPTGGSSDNAVFTVVNPPYYPTRAISQAANDMAWDSSNGLIYLSVPSTAAAYGNSVAALDPDAGMIVASQYAGSEPTRLALSDDNQFLYVGLNGAASVARFTLPSLTLSVQFSLGRSNLSGHLFAVDLQVAPDAGHTSAVSIGTNFVVGFGPSVVIFDDTTQRLTDAEGLDPDSLQWGMDATHLYAGNDFTTSFDLYSLAVGPGGVSLAADYQFVEPYLGLAGGRIHFDRGTKLVFSDIGTVVDPTTGVIVGIFAVGGSLATGWMVPDSAHGRAFFLVTPATGAAAVSIQVFDLFSAKLITSIPLEGIKGNPLQFIRWGPNGLAFCTDAGYVYLLSGSFVDGSG